MNIGPKGILCALQRLINILSISICVTLALITQSSLAEGIYTWPKSYAKTHFDCSWNDNYLYVLIKRPALELAGIEVYTLLRVERETGKTIVLSSEMFNDHMNIALCRQDLILYAFNLDVFHIDNLDRVIFFNEDPIGVKAPGEKWFLRLDESGQSIQKPYSLQESCCITTDGDEIIYLLYQDRIESYSIKRDSLELVYSVPKNRVIQSSQVNYPIFCTTGLIFQENDTLMLYSPTTGEVDSLVPVLFQDAGNGIVSRRTFYHFAVIANLLYYYHPNDLKLHVFNLNTMDDQIVTSDLLNFLQFTEDGVFIIINKDGIDEYWFFPYEDKNQPRFEYLSTPGIRIDEDWIMIGCNKYIIESEIIGVAFPLNSGVPYPTECRIPIHALPTS